MGYRNSALYTLKHLAAMLDEDEDFLRECSTEMFYEDGCVSAYDDYPASELSEHIILFPSGDRKSSTDYPQSSRSRRPAIETNGGKRSLTAAETSRPDRMIHERKPER